MCYYYFFLRFIFSLLLYRLDQSFVNTSTAATVNRLLALWNRIRLNLLHWPHNLCRFWCDEATASAQLYTCVYVSLCACLCMFVTERRNATVSMITQSMRYTVCTIHTIEKQQTQNEQKTKNLPPYYCVSFDTQRFCIDSWLAQVFDQCARSRQHTLVSFSQTFIPMEWNKELFVTWSSDFISVYSLCNGIFAKFNINLSYLSGTRSNFHLISIEFHIIEN